MRFVLRCLLALGFLASAHGAAMAFVRIDVDLNSQTMHVRDGSGETHVWAVSSGRAGHATPRGVFHPRALYAMVHSAKYNNAPMPHSIFFYGQYAIHGTNAVGALGSPASRGCIRLSPGAAAALFAMVQREGAEIRITGSPPAAYAHRHSRTSETALGYAPVRHHAATLNSPLMKSRFFSFASGLWRG
jgi:hypothetical protein